MEFKAVKSIINESGVKCVPSSSSAAIPSKLESKQKNIGKRSLANAISFSSAHYGSNEEEGSIHKIRRFSLESVLGMLDKIQSAIEDENAVLDTEILRLNTELFSQSENVFSFSESSNNNKSSVVEITPTHHSNNNNNSHSPAEAATSSSSGVSSPRAGGGAAGVGGMESARGGGRFRSRLNSVRDELFFLEDF